MSSGCRMDIVQVKPYLDSGIFPSSFLQPKSKKGTVDWPNSGIFHPHSLGTWQSNSGHGLEQLSKLVFQLKCLPKSQSWTWTWPNVRIFGYGTKCWYPDIFYVNFHCPWICKNARSRLPRVDNWEWTLGQNLRWKNTFFQLFQTMSWVGLPSPCAVR